MEDNSSSIQEFSELLRTEVSFISYSGKLSKGVLTHITRSRHNEYRATIEVPGFLSLYSKNKTVPINNILRDVPPSQKDSQPRTRSLAYRGDEDGTSVTIPGGLGLYNKSTAPHFNVGDSVLWNPNGVNPAAAFFGTIKFIGRSVENNYAKYSTMAVVQFEADQLTNRYPHFMGENRNAVPIENLQHLPQQQVETQQKPENPSGSSSSHIPPPPPRALERSKVSQMDVDLMGFEDHPQPRLYSTAPTTYADIAKRSPIERLHQDQHQTSWEGLSPSPSHPAPPPPASDPASFPTLYHSVSVPPTSHTTSNNFPFYLDQLPSTSQGSASPSTSAMDTKSKKSVKGIQGSNNSCYLDSSLFALFAYSTGLDSTLEVKENDTDDVTKKVKVTLRDRILKPLRDSQYVPSENINLLRSILEKEVSHSYKLSFMDAEEFILSLFELLGMPELFQYDNGASDHIHQIILPQDWNPRPYVTVQHLVEQSFQESSVKLTYIPNVFIVKLPVSNGVLISSTGVIPNLTLNLSQLLCPEISSCFGDDDTPQLYLSAVICLRSSHFVTFARNGVEDHSPWFFMDSNPTGFRPELTEERELYRSIRRAEETLAQSMSSGEVVDHIQNKNGNRLFRDAYICVYVSKYS